MYEEHPSFKAPPDENIKIWRYMDFTKFASLLDTRRLFFNRSDKFKDRFEGSWPKANHEARRLWTTTPARMAELSAQHERIRKYFALNCWHMNEVESAGMWDLYIKSGEGVAIQSTFQRLKRSMIDDESVYIGVVKYIDYSTASINQTNLFNAYLHKRQSFEHEREIRAIVNKWPPPPAQVGGKPDHTLETMKSGIDIKVDIERLIEKVYIAPGSPDWFADLVKAVTQRYGYQFPVSISDLDAEALY
jgi:hypothetical protein